jgi:superfamily II DNA or RNA helicase
MGLSATVQRKDGLAYVFQWFLGEVCYRPPRGEADDTVDVEVVNYTSRDPAYCEEAYIYGTRLNMARMVSNVCAHRPRTRLAVGRLLDLAVARGIRGGACKVLVLSERRNHLIDIEREIREAEPDVSIGYYVGGLTEERLKAAEGCSIILGTYAMAAEGMDIPALDTLLLASPKSDIEQSVGRILRTRAAERVNTPLIVDVLDDFSVFRAQAAKRRAYFKKRGYTVTHASPRAPRRE